MVSSWVNPPSTAQRRLRNVAESIADEAAFGEVGPGNNLGLLASKAIGPTAARGQLYGIAAAIGKVGGFIGTYTFPQIQESFATHGDYVANTGQFWLGSGLAVASALITFFFIPNIKADAMVDEDLAFREYLIAHGYDVSLMGTKEHELGGGDVEVAREDTKVGARDEKDVAVPSASA